MNTEHSFDITAVYSPQPDNGIDPIFKRLCDELGTARMQKEKALNNLLKNPLIIPETAVPFGDAHLRWKRAVEAVKGYKFGLL
jgi:hypothetical protein